MRREVFKKKKNALKINKEKNKKTHDLHVCILNKHAEQKNRPFPEVDLNRISGVFIAALHFLMANEQMSRLATLHMLDGSLFICDVVSLFYY